MIQYEKLGIFLSKPIALLLVVIYLVQSALLVYLIKNKFDLEHQVNFQQKRISELEDKLQILKAIDDFQIGFNEEEVSQLSEVIYNESKKYEYDPLFVMALILTESSFKKDQTSGYGARGLMQVVPFVGEDIASRAGVNWSGQETLRNSESNIKLGTLHLFEYILKFGDVKKAIMAYNVGEGKLRDLIKTNQPLPEGYLKKVMDNYGMLKETYRT